MRSEAVSSALVVRTEPHGDGSTRLSTEKGSVTYAFPKPDVVVARYAGILTVELFRGMDEVLARRLALRPSLRLYVDLGDIEHYEPAFREGWAGWFRAHRAQTAALHVLFRSRLVGIGLTVISVALGASITTYSDRAAFERVVSAA